MPLFREEQGRGPETGTAESPRDLAEENASLQRALRQRTEELERLRAQYQPQIDLERVRAELEQLPTAQNEVLKDRLFVRVLEIDPENGGLWYPDASSTDKKGLKIADAKTAHELIRRHREEAAGRELYYAFLLPRGDIHGPTERQLEEYKR